VLNKHFGESLSDSILAFNLILFPVCSFCSNIRRCRSSPSLWPCFDQLALPIPWWVVRKRPWLCPWSSIAGTLWERLKSFYYPYKNYKLRSMKPWNLKCLYLLLRRMSQKSSRIQIFHLYLLTTPINSICFLLSPIYRSYKRFRRIICNKTQ